VLATAEWLRGPSWAWVAAAVALSALAVFAVRPLDGWRRRALAASLTAIGLLLPVAQYRLARIDRAWPAVREARIERAAAELQGELDDALDGAERAAAAAAALDSDADRRTAFAALDAALPRGGAETGLAVFDTAGRAWAWAGRHRLAPVPEGDSIAVRATGYYLVLETRRHSADGHVAVASVLVRADSSVPDRDESLAERFRERTGVGLEVYPPGAAPDLPDLFNYEDSTTAGQRVLFTVRPVPPDQGAAKETALVRAQKAVVWLAIAVLALALITAPLPREHYLLLAIALGLTIRAPVGAALGLDPLFSPATFYRGFLGPLSASAGVLALASVLVVVLAVALWCRPPARRLVTIVMGVLLLVLAPYLIRALGRGITPPAGGVSLSLWLTWELTLLVSAAALIILAAALFRGGVKPAGGQWRIALGSALALLAAVVGVLVWSPRGGWPDWYTFLWVPALVLVALPAPRWAAIVGIATVAGSAAALVTWGAELNGRLQVAQRDVARLGTEPDLLALLQLERIGEALAADETSDAVGLYDLWRRSGLAEQGYPAALALWEATGTLEAELPLDSLDVPASLLAVLVRGHDTDTAEVHEFVRVPGVHYVLVAPTAPGRLVTVAVGPRTQLVPRGRLGRLLDGGPRENDSYRLALSPPAETGDMRRLRWSRDGWLLHAEQTLDLPDGMRAVHADIDLRGPGPLFVRGILVVLVDLAVLALLWRLAEVAAGSPIRQPRWRRLARSFRVRLAVTMAAFFIIPAVGFALWSFARLAEAAESGRDVLVQQSLRDAGPAAADLIRMPAPTRDADLRGLAQRVDSDLALYRGGRLLAASDSLLLHLAIVSPLLDPEAYQTLALGGELEVMQPLPGGEVPGRIGYRTVQPGTPYALGVLAAPQLGGGPGLATRQLDLALVLLLATILGAGAALLGARRAALTLSRPVAELRAAALAFGRGEAMPAALHAPPLEFEPVFGAFRRMAEDVRASQRALEAARRRTAAVLATVATGVVGLDPDGRVLIANREAVDLVGVPLREGDPFADSLAHEWAPLGEAVTRFLADPVSADAGLELDVSGRRYTLQLASLGADVRGVVLALSDVTHLSRVERVLAWGEMARKVAHEIKNPLTPMRLGMQHLQRVWRERPESFDATLQETAERILGEIDRLDTIARAFSRFAAPAEAPPPLERVDLRSTAEEVVQLYRLAAEGAAVVLEADGAVAPVAARRDEVKEVLVNLLENARDAGAGRIVVRLAEQGFTVQDDGRGITPELLPRIFEPRFSTTTSGSGLGLPIVRRLVDGWGGSVEVESAPGRGTTVSVRLRSW
jgi:signal transduction histidine kinase